MLHSSTHIIGIGIDGRVPDAIQSKNWMYFPDPDVPFYRATVFSSYSPNNVPNPDSQWSIMCECAESPVSPVDGSTLPGRVVDALLREGFVKNEADVASVWRRRAEHGYPTPSLRRDVVLDAILPELERRQAYSRGRFGAWKYEVSNQDHSFMQGVEVVDRIVAGKSETTLAGTRNKANR